MVKSNAAFSAVTDWVRTAQCHLAEEVENGRFNEAFFHRINAFSIEIPSLKQRKEDLPLLVDYVVTIPPGGRTDALVETVITWHNGHEFKTRGLDPDQTSAAIKATIKMLNIIANDFALH